MKLITKSDLARIAGCSPATVTRAAKTSLKGAMVVDRVDLDHWEAQLFIAKHAKKRARR